MTRPPAFLASLAAARPSPHEQTSFTVYATLPLSRLRSFRSSFDLHDELPCNAPWEPPVVLVPGRWPEPGEPDEAVIAEANLVCLEALMASDRLTAATRAGLALRLTSILARAPAAREPA